MSLASVTLQHQHDRAEIALFGAHVTSYIKDGCEKLFVSELAKLDGSRPIRGGIPVCWPWFGQLHPDIKQHGIAHGLVRNQMWQIIAQIQTNTMASVTLEPTDTGHALWPEGLSCQVKVTLTDALKIELITHNNSNTPSPLSAALHTYFTVCDISTTAITGVAGAFTNNLNSTLHKTSPELYVFTEETDRVHQSTTPKTTIKTNGNTLHIVEHQGHDSLVVWNPWLDKATGFVDMADDEYQKFVCIETALTQGYEIAPGQTHNLVQIIQ